MSESFIYVVLSMNTVEPEDDEDSCKCGELWEHDLLILQYQSTDV